MITVRTVRFNVLGVSTHAKVNVSQFIEHGCRNNPWVQLPGWHIDLIYEDWLHVTDLALVPDAAASVSWFCIQTGHKNTTPKVMLRLIKALVELCESDLVWQGRGWWIIKLQQLEHVDLVSVDFQHLKLI